MSAAAVGRIRVVIVGGGAAGVLVAAQLRRLGPMPGSPWSTRPAGRVPARRTARRIPGTCSMSPRRGCRRGPTDPTICAGGSTSTRSSTSTGSRPAPRTAATSATCSPMPTCASRRARSCGWRRAGPSRVGLADGRVLAADGRRVGDRATAGDAARVARPRVGARVDRGTCVHRGSVGAGRARAAGGRKPARVLVIGSGLTGVDVALHLLARGVEVVARVRGTASSRAGTARSARPSSCPRSPGWRRRSSSTRCGMPCVEDLAAATAAGADWRQVDRRAPTAHGPALAELELERPAPLPAGGPAHLGDVSAPNAPERRGRGRGRHATGS